MAWTAPVDPVSGTVITVTYAVTNILDPIRWLRLMTGNADPPGSAYVAVSDSVSSVTWKKIPSDALAAGAALANIGGQNIINGYLATDSVDDRVLADGAALANIGGLGVTSGYLGTGAVTDAKLATAKLNSAGGTLTGDLTVTRGGGGTGYVVFGISPLRFLGFDGSQFQLGGAPFLVSNGDLTVTRPAPNAGTGFIILGNNAAHFIGYNGSTFVTDTGKIWTAGDFAQPTATRTAGRVPIADASGSLDSWVTTSGGGTPIPVGLGGWVRTAAEIPAGFARETSLDGLMLIGAGTSFSQTFNETQTYGSTWLHNHSVPVLTVAVSSVAVSGSATGGASDNTGQPSATGGTVSGTPPPSFGTNTHTHSLNGVSLAVSASGSGSGSTSSGTAGNTTWLPPMRAVVWVRKT